VDATRSDKFGHDDAKRDKDVRESLDCVKSIPSCDGSALNQVGLIRARKGSSASVFLIFIRVLNRRVLPVKFFTRGLVLFMLCLGMLGTVGCGTDNETEGQQLAKTAGDPGAPSPKGIPETKLGPPSSQEERFQRQMDSEKGLGKEGYPGVKK
jgi:hypothetical protein